MTRLTPEEQAEYEAEAEYSRNHQPINIPDKRKPTAYERISSGARAVRRGGAEVANVVSGIGASPGARMVRGYAERMNASDTMTGGYRGYQGPIASQPQPNQGSIVHPGNRLYVIEGSMLATGSGQRQERKKRGSGGLGIIPGFGNDPGM
jgi:hypothetical protein